MRRFDNFLKLAFGAEPVPEPEALADSTTIRLERLEHSLGIAPADALAAQGDPLEAKNDG